MIEDQRAVYTGGESQCADEVPHVERTSFVRYDQLRDGRESLRAFENEALAYGRYHGRQRALRFRSSTCFKEDLESAIERYIDLKFGVRGVITVNAVLKLIPHSIRENLEAGVREGFASYANPAEVTSSPLSGPAPYVPSPDFPPPEPAAGASGSPDSSW